MKPAFNFETFREYREGFRHYHQIAWPWWTLIMDNNPLGDRPHFNPQGEMPWDIPF